jgi:hypothetical protein
MTFLYLICVILGAFFWAGASVMQFRFSTSIFAKWNNQGFWNPALSHNTAPKIFNYKVDGFHLFQSASILSFCIPIAAKLSEWQVFHQLTLNFLFWYLMVGIAWNLTFENAYERFFTIKNN